MDLIEATGLHEPCRSEAGALPQAVREDLNDLNLSAVGIEPLRPALRLLDRLLLSASRGTAETWHRQRAFRNFAVRLRNLHVDVPETSCHKNSFSETLLGMS